MVENAHRRSSALPTRYFLGLDGGGTRTTAWISDQRGRVVARAESGASNPLKVGFAAAQHQILRAVTAARKAASMRSGTFDVVCAGLAGSDRPVVHRRMLAGLRKSVKARIHILTTDAAIALQAALGDSPGILVISGTGSIACGRDEHGAAARAGGWGIPFDDAGSGYDVGLKAVKAALRDFDGRGPHTLLTAMLRQALCLDDLLQIIARKLTQQEVAALFPLVLRAARRGDTVARRLCDEAGRDLAELVLAPARRLRWQGQRFTVACAGGVFRTSAEIRRSFTRYLKQRAPRARVILLGRPPVGGALELARRAAQPERSDTLRDTRH